MVLYIKTTFRAVLEPIDAGFAMADWPKKYGIGGNLHQYVDATRNLIEVLDAEKAKPLIDHPDTELLTAAEANAVIDELYEETYKVENPELLNANLAAKATTLDFDAMPANATRNEELKWMYEQGISGIGIVPRPPRFSD